MLRFLLLLLSSPLLHAELPFGINMAGQFLSPTGLGEASRTTYRAIQEVNIPCCAINFSFKGEQISDLPFELTTDNPYAINLCFIMPGFLDKFNEQVGFNFLKERYNIGLWVWELENFPDKFIPRFASYQEIWAPSRFAQKAIAAKSPIPVYYVPHAIEIPPIPSHLNREYFGLPQDKMIFLYAFDLKSGIDRKNPQAVIAAFLEAFSDNPNVLLILKNSRKSSPLQKLCQGHDNILIINKLLTREEMYAFTNCCDVFISLHRSEGFGLNIAEAMTLGKPVIATNYSGNTDFMTEENSYPVNYTLTPLTRSFYSYKKGELWAEPDTHHAASLLLHVYQNPEEAAQKGQNAAVYMHTHHSFQAIGNLIKDRLSAFQ